MKTILTLPVEVYNDLLGRCLLLSREYAILRNGIVWRERERLGASVGILCEARDAEALFSLAARFYPNAVSRIYKSADLRNSVDFHAAENDAELSTGGFEFWREMRLPEHVVHIYENDEVFLNTLQAFIESGFQVGDGVIAIATPAHLLALETRLTEHGVELDTLRAQDRYFAVEAEELLARFMVNGWPDQERFTRAVGDLIARAKGEGRNARGFGEMVALLWERGAQTATVRLECLWDDLCRRETFLLLCAYPQRGFTRCASDSITKVCAVHSKVIPSQGTRALGHSTV
jgi:MEDS: MEthanogen/methylotroph, DcmR Sensory domain